MATKQINVKIPKKLYTSAESFAQNYGYGNLQELIRDSLREKVYEKSEYDNTFTEKEIDLIDKIIEKSLEKGDFVGEKELMKALE